MPLASTSLKVRLKRSSQLIGTRRYASTRGSKQSAEPSGHCHPGELKPRQWVSASNTLHDKVKLRYTRVSFNGSHPGRGHARTDAPGKVRHHRRPRAASGG